LIGRLMRKASQAALERQKPRARERRQKMERAGVATDPQRAAQAMSTVEPRRARRVSRRDDRTGRRGPMNRQMKRQMERAKKGRRR
jgi:hypothetical protein